MVTVRLTQAQAERLHRLIYEAALSAGQAEEQAALSELHQVEDLPGLSLHFLKAFDLLGEELAVYALTPNQALIVGRLLSGREIED